MIQKTTTDFLNRLKQNNNKPWFDAHRKDYEAAKLDFANFVDQLIEAFGKKDTSIAHLKAKDCMFRINRDVRFSKDKSPYKTNFGASINCDGKKSLKAGYYFHLEPGQSFAGGGLWHPMAQELSKVRQEIDYNFADFKKIIQSKKFKDMYGGLSVEEGQILSRIPKGYEADNPAAALLKYKSYTALATVADTDLNSKPLLIKTVKAFEALHPFISFINTAIE